METVLAALIVISLILFAIPTLVNSALTAQNSFVEDWQSLQQVSIERSATSLAISDAQAQNNIVDLTIRNVGTTKLADFEEWDLILQYDAVSQGYQIEWVPYTTLSGGMQRWQVEGIYIDVDQGIEEAFEPDILNPGEQMTIRVTVASAVKPASAAQVTVSTPNGITASTVFICQ